jgi:hypothetical protein
VNKGVLADGSFIITGCPLDEVEMTCVVVAVFVYVAEADEAALFT